SNRTTGKRIGLDASRGPCSVVDAFEVQPPRRCRRAGVAPRAPVEQRCEPLGRKLSHRSDERAHHVAQETVGADLELERIAPSMPLRAQDVTPEYFVLCLGRRE